MLQRFEQSINFTKGIPEAAVVLDASLRAIFYNSSFLRLIGLSKGALDRRLAKGEFPLSLLGMSGAEELEPIRSALKNRETLTLAQTTVYNAHQEAISASITFAPILDPDVEGIVVIIRDHTAEDILQARYKKLLAAERDRATELERRVEERTRELEAAIRYQTHLAQKEHDTSQKLSQAFEDLEQLTMRKNEMFQNVSHEFRTPLTLIMTPIDAILSGDHDLPDEVRRRCETVSENALRLLDLINDLLDLSRIQSIPDAIERTPLELGRFLEDIVQRTSPLAAQRKIDFCFTMPPAHIVYNLSSKHLEKVILNLISNALKFCSPGDRIDLEVKVDQQQLTIIVRDTGPGIPQELQESIFDRFQQVEGGTTRSHGGTGLGLAIVREFTELLGGQVALSSQLDQGCTFRITFPASLKATRDQRARETSPPPKETSPHEELARRAAFASLSSTQGAERTWTIGSRGPRILLAEDDVDLARETAEHLAQTCQVQVVHDGAMALEVALKTVPHLLITDVMMPKLNGVELCSTLRDNPTLKEMPIIILSARSQVEDRISGREVGADTYLTKPFNMRELEAAVRGLLRSRMRLVGEYLLHERLGSGGQGEVWRAEDVATGAPAAVKLLNAKAAASSAARKRFQREGAVLRQLEHPNVVRVFAHGDQQDRFYLAMELLKGITLMDLLKNTPLMPFRAVAKIGCGLAAALVALHELDIIHRDIKCSNIMIIKGKDKLRNRVRILDFGIVRAPESTNMTHQQHIGTTAYMAPEIFRNEPPTPAVDIYAAGVVLFTAATRNKPYKGDEFVSLMQSIVGPTLPRAKELRPDIHPQLDEIIARAMAKDFQERWTAEELLFELEQLICELDKRAIPDGTGQFDFELADNIEPSSETTVSRTRPPVE